MHVRTRPDGRIALVLNTKDTQCTFIALYDKVEFLVAPIFAVEHDFTDRLTSKEYPVDRAVDYFLDLCNKHGATERATYALTHIEEYENMATAAAPAAAAPAAAPWPANLAAKAANGTAPAAKPAKAAKTPAKAPAKAAPAPKAAKAATKAPAKAAPTPKAAKAAPAAKAAGGAPKGRKGQYAGMSISRTAKTDEMMETIRDGTIRQALMKAIIKAKTVDGVIGTVVQTKEGKEGTVSSSDINFAVEWEIISVK
jgi:hypothetical protein